MEKVCPICNGMQQVEFVCPNCGGEMRDGGTVNSFLGPYSPYMESAIGPEEWTDDQCIHLLFCGQCGFDTRMAWDLIEI